MEQTAQKPAIFVFSTAYYPFVGGAEIAIEQVAKRLRNKFDFFIVTSRMRRDLPRREARPEGIVLRVGFGNYFDKFWLLIFGWLVARRELKRQNRKTLFWVMDFSFGAAPAGFLKIFYPHVPLVFTIQYGYGDERVKKGRFGLMNLAFRLILERADYVTAISNYLLNLTKKYGFIGENSVIHNGVDIENFTATRMEDKKMTDTVITVSRLVPKNGIDILIKAIAEVKKEIPEIKLDILGDGPERKRLEGLVDDLGLENNVKFFGSVPYDDLPQRLAAASVFTRPSRSEGMGNSFVEALAAGIPIIGTPVGGILDIIKDGETGLFCRVDDPIDLADKIKILLKDADLSARIVENGKRMTEERFSWDKIAGSYEQIFQQKLAFKKKVLIATGIYPPDIGGPATYSKILFEELSKRGIETRVITYGGLKKYLWLIRQPAYFLKVFLAARNFDIIYAQDVLNSGISAMIAAKFWQKKFLLKVVGDYAWEQGVQRFGVKEVLDDFLDKKYGFRIEFFRWLEKFVADRAAKIIVPSEYLKKVVTKWGIAQQKIYVVYNSYDSLKEIYEDYVLKADDILKNFNFGKDKLIISAGRLVPWKGFSTIIDVMPEILRGFPGTQLWIAGNGPEKGNLIAKIKSNGLEESVKLLGNLPRKELMARCLKADVFVLNTAYEGFSHQLLEIMELGKPIITTDAGGNTELIENNKEGLLIKFNDKKALGISIINILKDHLLAEKLGAAALGKAMQFSKDRMIKEIAKILENL